MPSPIGTAVINDTYLSVTLKFESLFLHASAQQIIFIILWFDLLFDLLSANKD